MASGMSRSLRDALPRNAPWLGALLAPGGGNSIASVHRLGLPWAVDNAAYSNWNANAFRSLLARVAAQPHGLLWVAVPDVVADARATLARFAEWRQECSAVGPLAFVGQDGIEDLTPPWDAFRCWFVGGSDDWKLSQASADMVAEAKRRGKLIHIGRVNSFRRLTASYDLGADSVDGTSLSRWGDKYIKDYCAWVRRLEIQPTLY